MLPMRPHNCTHPDGGMIRISLWKLSLVRLSTTLKDLRITLFHEPQDDQVALQEQVFETIVTLLACLPYPPPIQFHLDALKF